jgi:polysaccharide biosynthesis protein PslG
MRKSLICTLLCSISVLAISIRSYAQSSATPMASNPIQASNWSFQCFKAMCGTNGEWITTESQPGTVRLWDSGATWAWLNTSGGVYDWQYLDAWLDLIAEHQPRAVLYTFGNVPCWISAVSCNANSENLPGPPKDLTSSGSASFTAFVQALTEHCTAAGHCVKDYIKYWELWNEPNRPERWTGTPAQLYEMVKPIVPIIRNNVSGAIILTPPICGGDVVWMTSWLQLENANTRLSDYYSIHLYLNPPGENDNEPETRITTIGYMITAKNANGWTKVPWLNSETNFNVNFSCVFSAEVCASQLVRWHILQYAYQGGVGGAYNIGWYDWDSIELGGYDTYYYTMMKWLQGGTFTASCTNQGTVWSCPLTEAGGKSALIVWNSAGDSNYKPATQYVDYRSFNGTYGGATHDISAGQTITINTFPVMLE